MAQAEARQERGAMVRAVCVTRGRMEGVAASGASVTEQPSLIVGCCMLWETPVACEPAYRMLRHPFVGHEEGPGVGAGFGHDVTHGLSHSWHIRGVRSLDNIGT